MGPQIDLAARFWARVEKTPTCWLWRGPTHGPQTGYGLLYTTGGKRRDKVFVHRFAYELLIGPIPPDKHIHHICEQKLCVNPAHLEPVGPAEHLQRHDPNTPRLAALAVRETCKRGHPKSVYGYHNGRQWHCRECRRLGQNARRAASRSAGR